MAEAVNIVIETFLLREGGVNAERRAAWSVVSDDLSVGSSGEWSTIALRN
ncbi:hypothetical protein [Nonomuraea sp. KM90]